MVEATPICSIFLFLFLVATWFGQLHGGALRYLGFASSRATKIYGDLAKIYGASPQFFATVSGLTLDKGHKGLPHALYQCHLVRCMSPRKILASPPELVPGVTDLNTNLPSAQVA